MTELELQQKGVGFFRHATLLNLVSLAARDLFPGLLILRAGKAGSGE